MLHKKKSLKIKTKQKHITYVSLFLKKAIIGIFEQLSLSICKPGAIYGRKSNYFILTSSFKGALCIKYIKFSTSGVISRAFGATK